jgi:hypothetical protein
MKEKPDKAKVVRLAANEAKTTIVEWAERFDDEDSRIAVAIEASTKVVTDLIDAMLHLDDSESSAATLKQMDKVLAPMVEKLRQRVADQWRL